MLYAWRVTSSKRKIFHVSSRPQIQVLRDDILRLHGYEVQSTVSLKQALSEVKTRAFDLVLIDVEGENRVPMAEELCQNIRELNPKQPVAFVCNHRVAIDSDCPDEIIRAEFNPEALVKGVRQLVQ